MRSYDYDYQINGVPMLAADAGVEIQFADVNTPDSGRDEMGYFHRLVLREKLRTWRFTYRNLTQEEYRYLDSLFRGKNIFRFSSPAFDGSVANCMAYCDSGSITLYDRQRGFYKNLTFAIVEC